MNSKNATIKSYPMQFRDKIDEYLWKEHQILGGCCSSVEEMKYSVAREVAEKLTNAFIEKACKYLESSVKIILCGDKIDTDKFIKDFLKAMKDEQDRR